MLDPKDPRVKQNLPEIKKKLKDPSLEISFIPSVTLQRLIIAGTHPMLQGMPKTYIELLLTGKPIKTQKKMLFDWLAGNMDAKNTFVLDNGEFIINNTKQNVIDAINAPVSDANPYKNVDFTNDIKPAKTDLDKEK